MKLNHLLTLLLIGVSGCQNFTDKIVIQGEISGEIPEKVEFTNPIHGACNWWFTKSVQPDSLGKFRIEIESEEAIFIKLRTSYSEQGTLIAEPGKTYHVRFNLNDKEHIFSVTDESSVVQEAYNKLPNPEHIQVGAGEFLKDTLAGAIQKTIEQRRNGEIAEFEKFFSDKLISQNAFDLIKTDRNCYYDALLTTVVWLKDYMTILGRQNSFTDDFEQMWKEKFKDPLFSNPEVVKSPWFRFYALNYIYFQEFLHGNFTKEKFDELNGSQQPKTYRVSKAKEYLPATVREDYLADYLYEESFQKEYKKELIGLFKDFKTDYPESEYIPYISPMIDEIIEFHKIADSGFSEKTKLVANYQNLNSLAEVTGNLPDKKIYVDVWATWCGPCKAEFEHKDELKKLLQKYGIPVLYISIDRDQDSLQWKDMIKFYNLEGYHVRANEELNAGLRKIFDRNGSLSIPWYILVDNDGNILKKHASRPSQINELEKEINE